MSKNKELMRQYENGEISANRLFKEQDEVLAVQVFIALGILAVLLGIGVIVALLMWI